MAYKDYHGAVQQTGKHASVSLWFQALPLRQPDFYSELYSGSGGADIKGKGRAA